MQRFKIDFHWSSYAPFGLYIRRPCWHHFITGLSWWECTDHFQTRDEAAAQYEKIKALPEYLD